MCLHGLLGDLLSGRAPPDFPGKIFLFVTPYPRSLDRLQPGGLNLPPMDKNHPLARLFCDPRAAVELNMHGGYHVLLRGSPSALAKCSTVCL
jgi:hypothetical protein